MAIATGVVAVADSAVLVGTVVADRRIILVATGEEGVFIGPDNTVSSTTGFFVAPTTADADHAVGFDLKAGDSVWTISAAAGGSTQTVYYLTFAVNAGT